MGLLVGEQRGLVRQVHRIVSVLGALVGLLLPEGYLTILLVDDLGLLVELDLRLVQVILRLGVKRVPVLGLNLERADINARAEDH